MNPTPDLTFSEKIKKWNVLDKQLKYVNEKTRQIRETKNALCNDICEHAKRNGWDNKSIDINDGTLKILEKREYTPLSFTYIEETLDEIISDKEQVDYIVQYLKDHREVKTTYEIRKYNT